MADKFVRVRLLRVTGVDLSIFDFDFDLTWAALFMNADGLIYGRYGGRDAKGPDTRNTLPGLRHALAGALESHQRLANAKPQPRPAVFAERFALARKVAGNGCIHCHQVKEIRRHEDMSAGTWKRDNVWVYPLPENVGVTLDLDRGNRVKAVQEGTPAARAGIKAGDELLEIHGHTVFSFADVQYALHRSPLQGEIEVVWRRDQARQAGTLKLEGGWKKTNLTWRPSLLDLLPSLTVFGYDLTAKEKKSLDLEPRQLAFRQIDPVHAEAQAMGVRVGDVILGVDNLKLEMTAPEFLGYVRQNYLVGERLTLNLLRDGKKVDVPVKLR